MPKDIKICIDPIMADSICRMALRKYAVHCGLDDKENFATKNWHWHSKNKRQGVTFMGQEVVNA